MAVLQGSTLIRSDQTGHQARSVGQGGWVVSFLPGRTLTEDQAIAALRAADQVLEIQRYATLLGLTALELVAFAATETPWLLTPQPAPKRWPWPRGASQ